MNARRSKIDRQCRCGKEIKKGDVYLSVRLFKPNGETGAPYKLDECADCARVFRRGHLIEAHPASQPKTCKDCGTELLWKHNRRSRLGRCSRCYSTHRRRQRGVEVRPRGRRRIGHGCLARDWVCTREAFYADSGLCRRCYQRGRLQRLRAESGRPTRTPREILPVLPKIGHWHEREDRVTVVHWPVKGLPFPYTCPVCDEKILEASA